MCEPWVCAKCSVPNESHVRCGNCWSKRPSHGSARKRPRAPDENVAHAQPAQDEWTAAGAHAESTAHDERGACTPLVTAEAARDARPRVVLAQSAVRPLHAQPHLHRALAREGPAPALAGAAVPAPARDDAVPAAPPCLGLGSSVRAAALATAVAGLSDEQRCVVVAPVTAAQLVVASPGSGKTRVLSRRIAHLVASSVRPSSILALTFSRRAARELRERVLSLGAAGVDVLTFHALCVRLVRSYAPLLGVRSDFGLCSGAQQLQLVQIGAQRAAAQLDAAEAADGSDSRAGRADSIAAAIRDAASSSQPRSARKLLRALTDAKSDAAIGLAARGGSAPSVASPGALGVLLAEYEGALLEQNCIDFCDAQRFALSMLAGTHARAQRAVEGAPQLPPSSCAFRHILLDEFQDTSALQFALLRALIARSQAAYVCEQLTQPVPLTQLAQPVPLTQLAQPAPLPAERACGLTIAGDPQQSIFGFRGAAPVVFEHALRSLPGGAPAVRMLATNYRSSGNIVRACIAIFAHPAHGDAPAPAARAPLCGRHALDGAALAMRTNNSAGAPVDVVEARVVETEADFIAARLHAFRAGGCRVPETPRAAAVEHARGAAGALAPPQPAGGPCAWGEMAVLHRTNREGAELCALLRARGVPAEQRGHSAFAGEAAGILMCALRCAASAADDAAFGALAEAMRVPAAALHALRSRTDGTRLLDAARKAHAASGSAADGALLRAAPTCGADAALDLPLEDGARSAFGRVLRAIDAIRAEARAGELCALPDVAARAGVLDGAHGSRVPREHGVDAPEAPSAREGAHAARAEPGGETRKRRVATAVAALAAEADAFLAADTAEADAEADEAAVAEAATCADAAGGARAHAPQRRGGLCALRRFVAHAALCTEERSASDGASDSLPVLTIHAAKGLEFRHVVLARVNEDCLPLASARSASGDGELPSGQLDEERRLAYVGATRAQQTLALTYVTLLEGAPMRRSRFLDGVVKLPPSIVRRLEAYEPRPAGSWPSLARTAPRPAARRPSSRRAVRAGV
ncbi:hypothetical protein KFE25_000026 [Diacronema lutheri]|uniref:DNA 3'-5' helicase n=1 Tax=Diacronema lutheri TaxID=2081491 RepID=A0A8J5XGU7_DIALT|nr:hypothetical protein KFE25_000026 [Diacronema lutheri]